MSSLWILAILQEERVSIPKTTFSIIGFKGIDGFNGIVAENLGVTTSVEVEALTLQHWDST